MHIVDRHVLCQSWLSCVGDAELLDFLSRFGKTTRRLVRGKIASGPRPYPGIQMQVRPAMRLSVYLVMPSLTFTLRRCLCRCLVAEGGSTVPIDGGSASESMVTQESRQFGPGSWFGRHPGNSRMISSPSCPRHECNQAPVHLQDFQERRNRRGTSTEKCRPI